MLATTQTLKRAGENHVHTGLGHVASDLWLQEYLALMSAEDRVRAVSQFARDYLMKTGEENMNEPWGPRYRWEHTLRVANWARALASKENIDNEKCVTAALFHDVSHFVSADYRRHGVKSAEIAREFMSTRGYPNEFQEDVCYAIESHVGEHDPKTVEAKILQDADSLDRFGYFRILLFGKTSDLSNLVDLGKEIRSFLGYLDRLEQGDFGAVWTRTAEARVAQYVRTYRTVYNGVLEEIKNTCLT